MFTQICREDTQEQVTNNVQRGPQTLEQVLALYASPIASKAAGEAEAHELGLVAENVDRSPAL